MIESGDAAPAIEAPIVTPEAAAGKRGEYTADDVGEFVLADALADGPVVLAFFPGVFSRTCTEELCRMRDWWTDLGDLEASVYGVSVDPPFPQLAFLDAYDVSFPLLSGFSNDVAADYGVRREEGPLRGIAERAAFVIAPDRTVVYDWLVTDPQIFPDLDAIQAALAEAGAPA